MLDPDVLAGVRIGPPGDVARREDPGHAGFEKGIHDHAAVKVKPRRFGKSRPRTNTDPGDDEIRGQCAAAVEFHRRALDAVRLVSI